MADIPGDTYEKLGIIGTLVVIGGAVVRWLLGDRKSIENKLLKSEERERLTSEKRTADLTMATEMLRDSSALIKESLAEVTLATDKSTEELQRFQKELEILQNQVNELTRVYKCSTSS